MLKKSLFFIFSISIICFSHSSVKNNNNSQITNKIIVGAGSVQEYKHLLIGKNVGIVANHTSVIFKTSKHTNFNQLNKDNQTDYTHIVDSLLNSNINVIKIFTPEHGYKGEKPNGANISDDVDKNTGLEIISLHGKKRKYGELLESDLKGVDVMIFDIQDVGVRFYTHISTLHYVMKACALNNIPLIVLDRPNPNIHYVDGPVLETENKSFVGMHKVPIVYGMTIGEYSTMINGENWLEDGLFCDLTVVNIKNYNRNSSYSLPIKPSPNLPNDKSINLYPSLCLFEGTNISVGRGTNYPFQHFGSPYLESNYSFTPKSGEGSKYPKHENLLCFGTDLRNQDKYLTTINLNWIIQAYRLSSVKKDFFNTFFDKLAGSDKLRKQIISGKTEKEIKEGWEKGIKEFKKIRRKYMIYK